MKEKIKSTQEDKCMNSGLKKYFPMIRERQEVLKEKYKLNILIISEKGIMHNMSEKPDD